MSMALRRALRRFPALFLTARKMRHKLRGYPEPEMGLLGMLADPSRISLDIGAHSGLYAEALIPHSKAVVAVEANPHLANDIRSLLGKRVQVVSAAMSSKPGEAQLRVPTDGSGLSTIDPDNPLVVADTELVTVECKTLDDLAADPVGFVKIDVEGHELEVLRGGLKLLERDKPTLLIEAEERHRANAVGSIRALLEPLGYRGLMLRDGRLVPIETFDPALDQAISEADIEILNHGAYQGRYVNNFIFIA